MNVLKEKRLISISRKLNFPSALLLLFVFVISSCKTVDIRTDYALQNNTPSDIEKGKKLLKNAYLEMGYDKFENTTNYEVSSLFKWKFPWTMMPMNALPGNKGKNIRFRFSTNDFNGQVTYLDGRKKGKTYGLQSWKDYRFTKKEDFKTRKSKRYNWGLATYHYVIEAPMRLLGADIIRYAGEKEFNGNQYDVVYATWKQDAPHKEHDQWLVYINKHTGMIDLTEITINDFFLPMPPGMKGATILTERKLTANGSYLPSFVTIQLGKPKSSEKYVYTFELNDYKFDAFPKEELFPIKELEPIGDAKIILSK